MEAKEIEQTAKTANETGGPPELGGLDYYTAGKAVTSAVANHTAKTATEGGAAPASCPHCGGRKSRMFPLSDSVKGMAKEIALDSPPVRFTVTPSVANRSLVKEAER